MAQTRRQGREVGPGDRVLVTGAAGGVGRHVVRALLDAGCDVRAADRRPIDYDAVSELIASDEVEWITTDLDYADLGALVENCRAVIHCAAEVGLSESYEELADTNVLLVEGLWNASREAGVRHFIHFSAGAIYRSGRGMRSETDAIEPSNAYERSKRDSEKILLSADISDQGDGTRWTILRPALIYGPHTESMGAGLVTLPPILRNFIKYLPGFTGGTRTNWCHVVDVAAGAMAVLGNPNAYGEVFNVADETPIGFGEMLTATTEAYDLDIGPLIPFPSTTLLVTFSPVVDRSYVANTLRTVLRGIWKRVCKRHGLDSPLRPKVDRNALFYVADDTVLDADKLRQLGWAPKWPRFQDGIVDTVRWYQEHAWVPRFNTGTRVKLRDERGGWGFSLTQTMTGMWFPASEGTSREVQLTVDAEFPHVTRADFTGHIDGVATFAGLAEDVELEGTVEVKILSGQKIVYEFGFDNEEEIAFRCMAEASFNPLQPLQSLNRLEGRVTNRVGDEVGKIELSFDFADQLVPILLSFRVE